MVDCRINFGADMDTSVVPANASWEFKVDSVVRAVTDQVWITTKQLRVNLAPQVAVGVGVTVELLVEDDNLHALGGANVLPFGPETLDPA